MINKFSKIRIPWNKGKRGIQVAWNKGKKFPEFSGENNHNWKIKTEKICQCGKSFKVTKARERLKFCSQQCYWDSLKGRKSPMEEKKHTLQALTKISKSWFSRDSIIGENNYNWKGGIPLCIDCGRKLSHRGHIRCYQCKNNGQSKENHWNWKGGVSIDKTKWARERRRIRYKTDKEYKFMLLAHSYKRRAKGYITSKIIQQVYEENIKEYGTLTCYLCFKPIEFGQDCLEHKTPLSRGGTNEYNNLAIAHRSCNCKKNNKTLKEFQEVIFNG